MFHHLLVPLDLSPRAELALTGVRQVASPGATVELLHVVEMVPGLDDEEVRAFYAQLEARGRRQLESWAQTLEKDGFRPSITLKVGKRAIEIIRRAQDSGCDLLLLASHALNPEDPARSLGTVSHQVALVAPCPVLLLR